MTGRALSFASLLVAYASVAHGAEPVASTDAAHTAGAPAPLNGRWRAEVRGQQLVVHLEIENTAGQPVDYVAAYGRAPGPEVAASRGEASLEPVFTPAEERMLWSRMGPAPEWQALAAGATTRAGTWRFELPKGRAGAPVELTATVQLADGPVTLRWTWQPPRKGQQG